MLLPHCLRQLAQRWSIRCGKRRRTGRIPARTRPRVRPRLEVLEDRLTPSGYSVTDLGSLPDGFTINSSLSNINNSGQVAEQSGGHVFLYSNGQWTDLAFPLGETVSGPLIINNTGQIVTWANDTNRQPEVLLYSNGKWTDLGEPSSSTTFTPSGMNDSGQIVGEGVDTTNNSAHAFLYSNGQWTDLGLPSGFALSQADSINNSGQIAVDAHTTGNAQEEPFLYSNGKWTDLGALSGFPFSFGYFINSAGQIVVNGYNGNTGAIQAFLYSNGSWTNLGSPEGLTSPGATGLNNSGQIVGGAFSGPHDEHAFLSSNGQMTDLNSLLPAGTSITLNFASSINDSGQIVAVGGTHDYLLTPQGIGISNGTVTPGTLTVSSSGQQVTVSATIDNNGSPATAGNVVFSLVGANGTLVSDGPTGVSIGSNGQASDKLTVPAGAAAGSYSLQVAYTNNNQTQTQSFASALKINAIPVTIALSNVAPTQFVAGASAQDVTATVTVTLANGGGSVKDGTVTFGLFEGATPIGKPVQVQVVNGKAQLTSSNPLVVPAKTAAGTYTLRAAYSDAAGQFAASQPATAQLTITAPPSSTTTPTPTTPPAIPDQIGQLIQDVVFMEQDLVGGDFAALVQDFDNYVSLYLNVEMEIIQIVLNDL